MSNERKFPINEDVLANLLSINQWIRILLMIAIGIVSWLLGFLQIALAVVQALFVLVTANDNLRLRRVGMLMALYQAHIWLFMSYATDRRPFPFTDLPEDISSLDLEKEQPSAHKTQSRAASSKSAGKDADDVFSDMSFTSGPVTDSDYDNDDETDFDEEDEKDNNSPRS